MHVARYLRQQKDQFNCYCVQGLSLAQQITSQRRDYCHEVVILHDNLSAELLRQENDDKIVEVASAAVGDAEGHAFLANGPALRRAREVLA